MSDECTVYVRNVNGGRIAIIDDFAEGLTASVRANDVGVLALDIPARRTDLATGQLVAHPLLSTLFAGNVGIEIVRNSDDRILWRGPMFEPARTRDADSNLLSLTLHDDIEWLNRRITHPYAPASAPNPEPDNGTRFYVLPPYSGGFPVPTIRSTLLLKLVDDNLGPSALAARQVSGFTLGADSLSGGLYDPTNPALGMPVLYFGWDAGTVLRSAQQMANGWGMTFAMIDGEFTVRQGVDRSATVVFEFEETTPAAPGQYSSDASLLSYEHRIGAPTANMVYIVTADNNGAPPLRDVYEVTDAGSITAWGRIESFYNDSGRIKGTASATMTADADIFLADKAATDAATLTTREGPEYGIDYELGDLVTARLDDGDYVGVVTEINITADKDGWRIQPILGARILNERNRTVLRVADLQARVTALEA